VKREGQDDIPEREVTILLADFATVWNELFPAEQARVVQLLVERLDVQRDALEVRIRAEGLASFGWGAAAGEREEGGIARLEPYTEVRLQARIGIATGPAVVGDVIGEGASREEAVVGETPNLAARLQALAAPGNVVISRATRRLLGGLFELADSGRSASKASPSRLPSGG
jgi:Adenylate and Guanylate cyclase catalytic domain